MNKILCFFGSHKWVLFPNKYVPRRVCEHCKKEQFADLQDAKWHEFGAKKRPIIFSLFKIF